MTILPLPVGAQPKLARLEWHQYTQQSLELDETRY